MQLTEPSLSDLLPQAEPMILLSGYDSPEGERTVSTWVEISSRSPFFDEALNGVPSCVGLEYMAQSMALLVGWRRRQAGLGPKLGFVLGSRRLTTRTTRFANGERYRVRVDCTYQDEAFGSFDCAIRAADGTVVMEGTLTAFQPEGEVTAEALTAYA